ncbi:MAG: 3-isopropylmalate dehydratase small subunit [Candidatus Hodarchaeota archaeon]
MIISRKGREYRDVLKGNIWVFPDNVDTDAISPSQYINDPKEMAEHTCETINKDFASKVKEGDIIVAGRYFGCGSSRETAPTILQQKGIVAIIAESFARIFYRSSFALSFPVLEIDDISKHFKTGEEVKVDIPNAEVINLTTGIKFKGTKIHPILLNLLKVGGLENQLIEELRE